MVTPYSNAVSPLFFQVINHAEFTTKYASILGYTYLLRTARARSARTQARDLFIHLKIVGNLRKYMFYGKVVK